MVFLKYLQTPSLSALLLHWLSFAVGIPVGYGEAAGAELTILGFTSTYGDWVSVFTALAMCCFAFSTIIGWGLYGARCIEFILGSKVIKPFMVVYSLVAILGATADLGLLWEHCRNFQRSYGNPQPDRSIPPLRSSTETCKRLF